MLIVYCWNFHFEIHKIKNWKINCSAGGPLQQPLCLNTTNNWLNINQLHSFEAPQNYFEITQNHTFNISTTYTPLLGQTKQKEKKTEVSFVIFEFHV